MEEEEDVDTRTDEIYHQGLGRRFCNERNGWQSMKITTLTLPGMEWSPSGHELPGVLQK